MIQAWLYWISFSTLGAAFLGSIRGLFGAPGLSFWSVALCLGFGALLSGFFSWTLWRREARQFFERASIFEKFLMILLLTGSSLCFLNLTAELQGAWWTSSPNNLADLTVHSQYIEYFVKGAHFPPLDPTFVGERLNYPYGVDLWDALWIKLGVPFHSSLMITGLVSLLISCLALWRTGGILLLSSFFFSGSMLLAFRWEKTFGPTSPYPWKNLFHAVLVTQRGFLFALPAGLFLIDQWSKFLKGERSRLSFAFFWIWAVLPFFHFHSFVVLSFWMALTILSDRKWSWGFVAMAPLAAFLCLRTLSFGKVSAGVGWDWAWMIENPQDFYMNFGIWLVIPIWLCWVWIQEKQWKKLFVAVVLTFLAFNTRTAPWPWDQIKILIWVYLLWTIWVVQEFRWKPGLSALYAFLIFWPGFLHWWSGLPPQTGRFQIQDSIDRAMVRDLLQDLSPEDAVLARVDHRHPLWGLGQTLVLGFQGQAYSYGLPYEPRVQGIEAVFSGKEEGREFVQKVQAKWVLAQTRSDSVPVDVWKSWGWTLIGQKENWQLWKIQN